MGMIPSYVSEGLNHSVVCFAPTEYEDVDRMCTIYSRGGDLQEAERVDTQRLARAEAETGAVASTWIPRPTELPETLPAVAGSPTGNGIGIADGGRRDYGPTWLAMAGRSSGSSSGVSQWSGTSAGRCDEPGDDEHHGEFFENDNGDWQRDYRDTHPDSEGE